MPSYGLLAVPFWAISLLAAAPMLWPVIGVARRRRRVRRQLCPDCAYDLRATPDRCPECGWTALTPAPPAAEPLGSRPQS
jgi:hypothetical protein